jgi:hypothetical protein
MFNFGGKETMIPAALPAALYYQIIKLIEIIQTDQCIGAKKPLYSMVARNCVGFSRDKVHLLCGKNSRKSYNAC